MDDTRVRISTAVVVVVAAVGLLLSAIGGTMAYFSSQAQGTFNLSTGELTIVAEGLDQTYAGLLPGQPQEREVSWRNAGTGLIDVYAWLDPSDKDPDAADYCDADVAPYLQMRIVDGDDDVLTDWTSICNLVNSSAGTGAQAPLLIAEDVPVEGTGELTMAVRLHPDADDTLQGIQRPEDVLVLFATQEIAPAPAPAGPAIDPVPAP